MIVATSFAAGLNVPATVATVGLLAHAGIIVLPEPLSILASWWVIGASGVLFVAEFVADKIPAFDLIWNALQTFVRVPAATLLAFGAASPLSPGQQIAAAVLGGVIALAAHGGKLAMRSVATASPEPFSNVALGFSEDAFSIFITWFATQHPYIAAGLVLVLVAMIVILIRWVVRAFRAIFRGARREMSG
jgi:hypothetical protein